MERIAGRREAQDEHGMPSGIVGVIFDDFHVLISKRRFDLINGDSIRIPLLFSMQRETIAPFPNQRPQSFQHTPTLSGNRA